MANTLAIHGSTRKSKINAFSILVDDIKIYLVFFEINLTEQHTVKDKFYGLVVQ
jgi:hypothetical protein